MPEKPRWPKARDVIDARDIYHRKWCRSCHTNIITDRPPNPVFQKIIPVRLPSDVPCCDNPDYVFYCGTETLITGSIECILSEYVPKGVKLKEWKKDESPSWIRRIQEKICGKAP